MSDTLLLPQITFYRTQTLSDQQCDTFQGSLDGVTWKEIRLHCSPEAAKPALITKTTTSHMHGHDKTKGMRLGLPVQYIDPEIIHRKLPLVYRHVGHEAHLISALKDAVVQGSSEVHWEEDEHTLRFRPQLSVRNQRTLLLEVSGARSRSFAFDTAWTPALVNALNGKAAPLTVPGTLQGQEEDVMEIAKGRLTFRTQRERDTTIEVAPRKSRTERLLHLSWSDPYLS